VKKIKEIIGLDIISIDSGATVGVVQDLVFNPDNGTLAYVVLNLPNRYLGANVIAFKDVLGVGEFALTVPNAQVVSEVANCETAKDLLHKNVEIIGTKVLTKKGTLFGKVQELLVDEESGKIAVCLYLDNKEQIAEVNSDRIITLGKDLIIIEDPSNQTSPNPQVDVQGNQDNAADSESFNSFELRQLEYLVGKSISKDVVLNDGNIVKAGDPITQETVEGITSKAKLIEISSYLIKE